MERRWRSGDGCETERALRVRLDGAGNLFWVERTSHTVRRLDAKTGVITTIAGTGTAGFSGDNGPARQAQLNDPHSICFDGGGGLYICDVRNHRVRKVELNTGKIITFSGTGERKPMVDGPIPGAVLHGPRAMDSQKPGTLWLALREGNAIVKFDLKQETVQRLAGTGKKGFTGMEQRRWKPPSLGRKG